MIINGFQMRGNGGRSGIRTHGREDPTPVFKTGTLNRSVIRPCIKNNYSC